MMTFRDKQNAVFVAMLFRATAPGQHIDSVKESQLQCCRDMVTANAVSQYLYNDINGVLTLTSAGKRKGFKQVEVLDGEVIEKSIYNDPKNMITWLLTGQNMTSDDRHDVASTVLMWLTTNKERSEGFSESEYVSIGSTANFQSMMADTEAYAKLSEDIEAHNAEVARQAEQDSEQTVQIEDEVDITETESTEAVEEIPHDLTEEE